MQDVIVWTAWIGGAGIGAYFLLQYWLTNTQLGCSTAYGNVFGAITNLSFFRSGDYQTLNNWRLWFILGIPLGGLIAALTSPGFEWQLSTSMGTLYDGVMPQNPWLKGLLVMVGGVLMGLGARMAGGCTSGHVIAGVSLLNPPSLLAGALFFVGGILAVQALFHTLG